MTPLHTRAFCDECGMRLAVVEISPAFFLCAECNSVTSGALSSSDVNVTAALAPRSAVTINSDPVPSSSRGPETSSPAVPVTLSFEAEVASLELKWMRAGIIMNAHTLAVMHLSRSNAPAASDISNSSSVAVS